MKLKSLTLSTVALALAACGNLNQPKSYWCPPEVVTGTVELATNALFKFNKSSESALLPKSKQALDEFIAQAKQAKVEKMELIGHADKIGSDAYNQKLGLARAETVKKYLEKQGVEADIQVSSKGKSESTTECKDGKVNEALKACLQPDRRVEVKATVVAPQAPAAEEAPSVQPAAEETQAQ